MAWWRDRKFAITHLLLQGEVHLETVALEDDGCPVVSTAEPKVLNLFFLIDNVHSFAPSHYSPQLFSCYPLQCLNIVHIKG